LIGTLLASHCCPLAVTWDIVAELIDLLPPTIKLACSGRELRELCLESGREVECDLKEPRGDTVLLIEEENVGGGLRRALSRVRTVVVVTEDPYEASAEYGVVGVDASRVYVPVERRGDLLVVRFSYSGFLYNIGLRDSGKFPVPPDYDALYNSLAAEIPRVRTIAELSRVSGFHEVPVRLALIHGWLRWGRSHVLRLEDWFPPGTSPMEDRASPRDLLEGRTTLLVTVPARYPIIPWP